MIHNGGSLPADVLWGSFVTHSFLVMEKWMRDKGTPKDVCGKATTEVDSVGHMHRMLWIHGPKRFFTTDPKRVNTASGDSKQI